MDSFEKIEKTFEILGKFALPIAVTISVALFLPDDLAKKIHLYEIREPAYGLLMLGLILSGVIALLSIGTTIRKSIIKPIKDRRRASRENKQATEQRFETLRLRLASLSPSETIWIKHCLHFRQQTLIAPIDNATANALVQKSVVVRGSGGLLGLPYTIRDEVWKYLTDNQLDYAPESDFDDAQLRKLIESFPDNLQHRW